MGYEGAVLSFIATAAGAGCIVMRNGRDFRESEVPVMSPGEFLVMQGE